MHEVKSFKTELWDQQGTSKCTPCSRTGVWGWRVGRPPQAPLL